MLEHLQKSLNFLLSQKEFIFKNLTNNNQDIDYTSKVTQQIYDLDSKINTNYNLIKQEKKINLIWILQMLI